MRARWAALSATPAPGQLARSEPDPDLSIISNALYDLIDARLSAFTLEEARKMPAVIRATNLLAGIAASLSPLAYRDGEVMDTQPASTLRPDPFGTRYDFVWQTVASMFEHGCAPWKLSNHDGQRNTHAVVLPHDEVRHEWAPGMEGIARLHVWRGRKYREEDLRCVTIGRRAGELCGRGPLSEMLRFLAPVQMAETWAMAWFAGGGVPDTVVTAKDGDLTTEEAAAIKAAWMEGAQTGVNVRVLPFALQAAFAQIDPERAQLHESRSYGNTVVATGAGIPAALLHVQTAGASITYSNAMAAVDELVKATIWPSYLGPIEAAWSELVPRQQAVRFDLNEMMRLDPVARSGVYQTLIAAGVMRPEEGRAFEGWSSTKTEAGHAFDPAGELVPA
jgi:HK97 family phage portal protein